MCVRFSAQDAASATDLGSWSFPRFQNVRIYLSPPSFLFSCLSFLLSTLLSGRGACGPVGRGLIPSAWGFCQRLVPFCVMVLTERTPHFTPIERWGWAAGAG